VVSQSVVGPYESVTVRSSQGEALDAWLVQNGYDVPASIQPTIDAYTEAGFDFIALKLRPGEGVQAMQPVRVIMPGAGTTFPLRMVAAGAGANIALELFVLSEGRYHPQNFPDATIDFSQLEWDPYTSLSNYETLAQQAMSASGGTAWLTEFAGLADLGTTPSGAINPGLAYAYSTTCVQSPPVCVPTAVPDDDAGADANDDGTDGTEGDGGDDTAASAEGGAAGDGGADGGDGGAAGQGGADGGDGDSAPATPVPPTCTAGVLCDDLALAMMGIDTGSLWVTRLRANFPSAALTADLVIEATSAQVPATNVHTTQTYTDPTYNPCPSGSNAAGGSSLGSLGGCGCRTAESRRRRNADVIGLGVVAAAVAFGARRRRRSRRASRP
jgi:MYXO-CTERM domain-containing protein